MVAVFVLLSIIFAFFCTCFARGDCFWALAAELSDFGKTSPPMAHDG